MRFRELALFAGAGGGILGGLLLGWRTVCAVEIDPYARSVLLARQRDGMLRPFPIWDDVATFDGKPWRGHVDVVSGGFPCQDISCAGKGAGLDGARSGLWSEFARIIGEVRPRFAFIENSPMLAVRGLDRVLADLAAMGFNAEWGVVSAADVGAPHLRERIWIVANACSRRCNQSDIREVQQPRRTETIRTSEDVAHARRALLEGRPERERNGRWGNVEQHDSRAMANAESERRGEAGELRHGESAQWFTCGSEALRNAECDRRSQMVEPNHRKAKSERSTGEAMPPVIGRWPVKPAMGRVAHGVAKRVDRLKAIGNGQVPRVAAAAWRILSGRLQ
jgi:DNA (cytosine-5)-methyltransferase 1